MAERLALLGLLILAALAPVVSVFASRAIGLLLPVAGILCAPLAWQCRDVFTDYIKRSLPWGVVVLAFVGMGLLGSEAPRRALIPVAQNLVAYPVAALIILAALRGLPTASLRLVWKALALTVPFAVFLIAFEGQSGMLLNSIIGRFDGSGTPPAYELDRGTVLVTLYAWVLISGPDFRDYPVRRLLLLLSGAGLIWFTTSQSAMVGLYCGILVYLVHDLAPRLFARLIRAGTLIVFMAMPFIAAGLIAFFGYDNNVWPDASLGQRLEIWGFATTHILDHPWVGYGLEAMRVLAPIHGHTHNGALQLWLDLGMGGAVLAGLLLNLLLRRADALPPFLAKTAHAAFAGWAVVFCVGYGIWQAWWMALGVTLPLLFALLRRLEPQAS